MSSRNAGDAHHHRFFDLAASLSGPTVIGLNRRLNDIDNGIAAAKEAIARMNNLQSLELGNEPDCKSLLLQLICVSPSITPS